MMPIELRTVSPLGAPYRSPLGVLGPGEAPAPAPLYELDCITGYFAESNFRWSLTPAADPTIPQTCPFDRQFQTGWTLLITNLRWRGTAPIGDAWYSTMHQHWYKGRTSGTLYRPSDSAPDRNCYSNYKGGVELATFYWQYAFIDTGIEAFLRSNTNASNPTAPLHPTTFQDGEIVDVYAPGDPPS